MAQCMTPFAVKKKIPASQGEVWQDVPCGKCPNCYANRVSMWSFRLMQQEKISSSAHFITLTYDTTNVPISSRGFLNLSKRDLQLFFKRLRKTHSKDVTIKYYAVGEYGGKTKRPHYHLILFNADVSLINGAWNLGDFHVGDVTGASIGYTLKYISKKWRPAHANDDRQPQFALMSKGLGGNYLTDAMVNWHLQDLENRMYCNLLDGKKISMPRYYKNKIYDNLDMDGLKRKALGVAVRLNMLETQKKQPVQDETTIFQNKLAAFKNMDKRALKDKL
jgi:hypothetical protein